VTQDRRRCNPRKVGRRQGRVKEGIYEKRGEEKVGEEGELAGLAPTQSPARLQQERSHSTHPTVSLGPNATLLCFYPVYFQGVVFTHVIPLVLFIPCDNLVRRGTRDSSLVPQFLVSCLDS
jgi:hypothetical protein